MKSPKKHNEVLTIEKAVAELDALENENAILEANYTALDKLRLDQLAELNRMWENQVSVAKLSPKVELLEKIDELKGEIENQQVDNAELARRLMVQRDIAKIAKRALDTRDELRQQCDALERENKEQATCIKMVTEANRKWEASYHEWKARAGKAEAKLAALKKRLWELRGFGLAKMLLGDFFPETAPKLKKAKEPELCGVCGGVRGCCLCLEGTQKHFSGIAERAKKVKAK